MGHLDGDTRRISQHPAHCYTSIDSEIFDPRGYYCKDDTTPIVFDSGCTVAVTPHLSDFIRPPAKVTKTMNGLTSKASVEAEGMVAWNFLDDYGVTQRVKVRAFYVPSSGVRLFSPQDYFKTTKSGSHGSFHTDVKWMCIYFWQ